MRFGLVLGTVLVVVFPAFLSARTWTSADGKSQIEAELVKVQDGSVVLQRDDGKQVTVPLERLCEADREFVRKQAAKQATAAPEKDEPAEGAEKETPGAFTPPDLPEGKVETPFSEPYEWFHAGGGGRYLFFFLKKSKNIAIFDLAQMKVVRSIEVPTDDALAAAGLEKLIVVLPAQRLVLRYDLKTFEREKSAGIPGDQPVRLAVMGSSGDGPLLLWANGDVMLWDVQRMKPIAVRGQVLRGGTDHGYDLRVSADGHAFVGWTTGLTGQEFVMMLVDGPVLQTVQTRDGWSVNGMWAMPNADASLLFVHDGTVYNTAMKRVGGDSLKGKGTAFPTDDPRWFVVVRPGKDAKRSSEADIWTAGNFQPVLTIKDIEPVNTGMLNTYQAHCRGEPRVRYLSAAKLLVTLPDGNDRLVVRRLDLIEELNRQGEDYLFVASVPPRIADPRGTFTYRIQAISKAGGVKYSLESGPPGMTLAEDGVLRWKPSKQAAGSTVNVVVGLRDASGKDALHSFEVTLASIVIRTAPIAPLPNRPRTPPARRPVIPPPVVRKPATPAKVPLVKLDALKGGPGGELSTKDIAARCMESVVVVKTAGGSGSGFVVGGEGYVLTAAHCVPEEDGLQVIYRKGTGEKSAVVRISAKVLFADDNHDLALLKVNSASPLPAVRLALGPVASGERVCVIGNPGLGGTILDYTVTEGIISSPRREFEGLKLIQTSAQVNPGTSGGPMFNTRGQAIGLVVLKGRIEGAGFALPSETIARFLLRHAKTEGEDGALERQWADASGARSIAAVYLGRDQGEVRLRRADGKEISVAMEKLSQADQEFVKLLPAGAGKPDSGEEQ